MWRLRIDFVSERAPHQGALRLVGNCRAGLRSGTTKPHSGWKRGTKARPRPNPSSSVPAQPSCIVLPRGLNDRSRRLLVTTSSDDSDIASPAISGLSKPAAATGMAATL